MIKIYNPTSLGIIPEPFAAIYSHAVETQGLGGRQLFISGQVGASPTDNLDSTFAGQLTQALKNVETILASVGMTTRNIVKVTYYLTRRQDLDELVKLRSELWHGIRPAVTVVLVAGLANPDWLIEVDAIAHEEASDVSEIEL